MWHALHWGWQASLAFMDTALHGMGAPWVLVLVLVLTTFLLEDVAIAAGAALATQGALSWAGAFGAVAGGIAVGDLGLYGLGLAATRLPYLRRRFIDGHGSVARDRLEARLPSAVLLARVIPGLRLLTYTACGFLRAAWLPFMAWVLVAVSLWTAGLFWLSSVLGDAIAQRWGLPAPVAVALPIVVLAGVISAVRHFKPRKNA